MSDDRFKKSGLMRQVSISRLAKANLDNISEQPILIYSQKAGTHKKIGVLVDVWDYDNMVTALEGWERDFEERRKKGLEE